MDNQRRDSIYFKPTLSEDSRSLAYVNMDFDCYRAPLCSRVLVYDTHAQTTTSMLSDQLKAVQESPSTGRDVILSDPLSRGEQSLAFSPSGELLASGTNDSRINLWQVTEGTLLKTLQPHTQIVSSVDISPDGNLLASGSHDGTVNIFNLVNASSIKQDSYTGAVLSIDFSPDSQHLAVGANQAAWIWEIQNGDFILDNYQEYPGSRVYGVAFSPDGEWIAHAVSDNTIWIRHTSNGEILSRLAGHEGDVLCLVFSPDGNLLASGSADNTVNLWRITNSTDGKFDIQRELVLEHANWVNDLAFSPNSEFLAVASFGSSLRLWQITDGEPVGKSLGSRWYQPLSVAFSPNGNLLAIGSAWGGIQLLRNFE